MPHPPSPSQDTILFSSLHNLITPSTHSHVSTDPSSIPYLQRRNPHLPIYDFSGSPPWGRRIDDNKPVSHADRGEFFSRCEKRTSTGRHRRKSGKGDDPLYRMSIDLAEEAPNYMPPPFDSRAGLSRRAACEDYTDSECDSDFEYDTDEREAMREEKEANLPDWPEDDYLQPINGPFADVTLSESAADSFLPDSMMESVTPEPPHIPPPSSYASPVPYTSMRTPSLYSDSSLSPAPSPSPSPVRTPPPKSRRNPKKSKNLKVSHRPKKIFRPSLCRSSTTASKEDFTLDLDNDADDESTAASTSIAPPLLPPKFHLMDALLVPYGKFKLDKGTCIYKDPLENSKICDAHFERGGSDLPRHLKSCHAPKEGARFLDGEFTLAVLPVFLITMVIEIMFPQKGQSTEEQIKMAEMVKERIVRAQAEGITESVDVSGLDELERIAGDFARGLIDSMTCRKCGNTYSRADALKRHMPTCKGKRSK